MLTINKTTENEKTVYYLEGRLDTVTSPELENELRETLPGISKLTFDLEELEYISSAGLRVLLSAQKTMNKQGEMEIIRVNEAIMEIFEITGFVDIMTISRKGE